MQRAAHAVYSDEGRAQIAAVIQGYQKNAALLREAMRAMNLAVYGGINAPYIWVNVGEKWDSWEFFDYLLQSAALVCTPGAGFGTSGEGYVRLTAFGSSEDTLEAIQRMRRLA